MGRKKPNNEDWRKQILRNQIYNVMENNKNVFVIYGGYYEEADVSVRSGKNVVANLDATLFNI